MRTKNVIKSFKCAQCGAEKNTYFYNMSDYVYKKKDGTKQIYFCGHNCMCAWEREKEERKRRNIEQRAKMIIKKRDRSGKLRAKALEMYLGGETLESIGIVLNKSVHTIQRYLRESGYKWNRTTRTYVKVATHG